MAPFQAHSFIELGDNGVNISWVEDPWTGGQIPDDKIGPNSSKLFIAYGKHDDAIDKWNASERNDLFHWLAGLGFDL